MLDNNQIKLESVIVELLILKDEFVNKLIYPIDLNLNNIVFQRITEHKHRLVLVDGYGITNIFPAISISKKLARKQIMRKFDRHISTLIEEYRSS
ncbi:hypothetical protein ACH42_06740 [Endozoicomonas sp. (ex Bugula neritina AB1)]|nr:hypothetical protein ACH42_06740 [Endozoicomonas sp. (ex Bugula neritina AB1)]